VGQPFVSVIVAARDAERAIAPLLAALSAQTLPRDRFEVLIVDDASKDRTTQQVAARNGDVRLIALTEARGAYAARNRALEQATGDVIAITDADCRPAPDWLERLVAALDDSDGVGGRIRTVLPTDPPLPALVDAARRLDQQLFLDEGFVAFANFACRRALIDAVGPFNEQLRSNGDREWCLRAAATGARFAYAADAIVDHPPRTTAREVVLLAARRRPRAHRARRPRPRGAARAQLVGQGRVLPRRARRPEPPRGTTAQGGRLRRERGTARACRCGDLRPRRSTPPRRVRRRDRLRVAEPGAPALRWHVEPALRRIAVMVAPGLPTGATWKLMGHGVRGRQAPARVRADRPGDT
jgi:GT2 family glycosyltransferase